MESTNMCTSKGSALLAVAAALLAAGATARAVANATPIVTIKGNAANKQEVLTAPCSGPDWLGPCEFTLSFTANVFDEDGIERVEAFVDGLAVAVINAPPPGCGGAPPLNVSSTFTHTFAPLLCSPFGNSQWHEIRFEAWDCTGLFQLDWQWVQLVCEPCEPGLPQVSAHSNGTTYVEPDPGDTLTEVQFVVANLSPAPATIDLGLLMSEPWPIGLPPPSVDLSAGESLSITLPVTVPGGLPQGTTNVLTLTAVAEGDPGSATTADAAVTVTLKNVFRDFSVDEVQILPATGTSYDVHVTISVRPWMPNCSALPLQLVLPDGSTGPFAGLPAFGQPSEQCCDGPGDCAAIPGWTVTCGPPSCIDPDQDGAHVCNYHKTVTFAGLYMPAGSEVTAVLDPDGLYAETEPGSGANNTLSADVPLPNVNRLIDAVAVVPGSGPGLFDIHAAAALEAILDENPLDLSAQYLLFVNGDFAGDAIVRSLSAAGGGGSSCYASLPPLCSGDCPEVVWEGETYFGTCSAGGSTCTCRYGYVKQVAGDVPLQPGDEVMVCLVALPGAEPEAFYADDCGATVFCPADLDGDGQVGITDFLALLGLWGPCPDCAADLDGDGAVGINDFLTLLASWGPCL